MNDPAPGSTNALIPLQSERLAQIDEAYQGYYRRLAEGEELDQEAYCDQFPSIRSALHHVFSCEAFIDAHPEVIRDSEWPKVGSAFLDYDLHCELGRGGFSRVYLASERKLGNRLVAVKIARRANTEANILGPISHPNIVPVYTVREDKARGLSLVCMPYAGSATLSAVIDRVCAAGRPGKAQIILEVARELPVKLDATSQPQPPSAALEKGNFIDGVRWIGAAIADALAHVHTAGICHRDLKPSNVLLGPNGVPMLLDFNLAAHVQETLPIGGTLPYMAPEVLRLLGQRGTATETADARADLFALGVMLYELATGQHPFGPIPIKLDVKAFRQTLLQRQTAGAVPAYEINPDVDRALSDLIQQCLAVDPKARPQSAAAIADALRRGATRPKAPSRWAARRTLAASLALLALMIAIPLAVGTRRTVSEPPLTTATELGRKKKFEEAVTHLTTALLADPKNDKILSARASVYVEMGEFVPAREDFERANAITRRGHTEAGIAYTFDLERKKNPKGSFKPSEYHYLAAIKHGYATPEVYNNLAFAYRKQGTSGAPEAWNLVEKAIKGNPQLQAAYCNRMALTHASFLRDVNAVRTLLTNPSPALAQQIKAEAKYHTPAELLDLAKEGLADIRKALKIGPTFADLHLMAARFYADGSDFDKTWVARMYEELELARDHGLDLSRNKDGMFDRFRTDPEFQRIARKTPIHAYVPIAFTCNPVPWPAD